MLEHRVGPLTLSAIAILAAAAVVAWAPPDATPASATSDGMDCTFAIRASNDLSFDVRVWLYDSAVSFQTVLSRSRQLKIQNHRIASGKSMDRRYTDTGRCSRDRSWFIYVQRGSGDRFMLLRSTGGTASDSRTVDLGRASKWQP